MHVKKRLNQSGDPVPIQIQYEDNIKSNDGKMKSRCQSCLIGRARGARRAAGRVGRSKTERRAAAATPIPARLGLKIKLNTNVVFERAKTPYCSKRIKRHRA
jgi:hypothetical protein